MIQDPFARLRTRLQDQQQEFDQERQRVLGIYEQERQSAMTSIPGISQGSPLLSGYQQPFALQSAAPLSVQGASAMTPAASQYGVPQPDLVELGPSEGWFEKSTRFLSNVLSPLSLAQDMLFATAAGWSDPDKSVRDYLSEMDWATYVPMGAIPERPVSGEQLLRLNGVEGQNAAFWGGLAMDLVADPLLVGGVVRGLARLGELVGAVRVSSSLNRAANAIDTVAEATMLVGATPTARVVSAARTLPGFRQFEQAVTNNVINRYVRPALEPLAQRTVNAPEALGGRSYSLGGLFVQDASRLDTAPEIIRASTGVSQELEEATMIQLIRADAMAGGTRWRGWLRSFNRSMSVMYNVPVQTVNTFTPATSRSIMTSAYAQADQLGLTMTNVNLTQPLRRNPNAFLPNRMGQSPRMRQAVQEVDEMLAVQRQPGRMPANVRAEERAMLNQFNSEVARLRQVAVRNGDDPDVVEQAYRGVVESFQRVSAIEGYFASGAGPMLEIFTQNLGARIAEFSAANPNFARAINRAGGVAHVTREAWRELIRSGRRNEAGQLMPQGIRLNRSRAGLPGANYLNPADRALLTYQNMFQDYNQIAGLDLPTYFNNLTRGHMRRAFGTFMDETSWQSYVSDMRAGNIVTNRIVNDAAVNATVRQAGLNRQVDLAEEYIRQISPPPPVGSPVPRPMGGFVNMTDLAEFMLSRGVTPNQFRQYQRAFIAAAQPELIRVADQLAQYGRANIGQNINIRTPLGTGADTLTTARQNLGEDEVDTLMELMDPIVSRAQTAVAAGTATRRMESLTGILREAQARGLMVDSATAGNVVPNWWVSVPVNQAGYLQGLGGMTVHPMIYREVRNVMTAGRRSHRQAGALQTLRSMITAGYLASPATSAANIAGGFWTAAMYGISPTTLMQNMVGVYRDWRRLGRDLPELSHMRGIVDNGQAHTEIVNMGGDLGSIANLGVGVRGFSQAITNGVRRYHEMLRRPFGTGALGLGFFELSEALFKMGTFRMVMNQTGNVDEARRMARHVVFDYANQPGVVQMARDTGLFLFPGFEYFMFGRTVNALANRPGMMGVMERLPGVITQAMVPDEDQRNAMLAGMPDWMLEGKFIPIRRKENGDLTMLPWSQLFPTSSMTGAPFIESLRSAGLWGPVIDTVTALGSISGAGSSPDPGEARLTGMGRRVLETGVSSWDEPTQVIGDVMSYLYNSFAPAILRKTYAPAEDFDRAARGLVPSVIRTFVDVPGFFADQGRSAREVYSRRVDQDLFDTLISFNLRTTRSVATSGPLADMTTVVGRAVATLERDINEMQEKIELAMREGNTKLAQSMLRRRASMIERFKLRWGDRLEELRRMSLEGRFQPPQMTP